MQEKYLNYVSAFQKLDEEDKKQEITKNIRELLQLLYTTNNKLFEENNALPIINNYNNEDEYLTHIFTYLISLKEENAKLIEYIFNNH